VYAIVEVFLIQIAEYNFFISIWSG